MTLSNRVKNLMGNPSAIVVGAQTCATDPWTIENTNGYLNFGIAENHLMDDLILKKVNSSIVFEHDDIHYAGVFGSESLKETISHFFTHHLHISNVKSENIVTQAGVSAICEALSFALFDEGDYILIPTPYYTGFDHDFTKRFKAKFLKAHLKAENNFLHDINVFKETYEDSEFKNKVKAILITSPHNPTGEVLDYEFMQDIVDFALENNLHIISDEIYALSTFENRNHISLFELAKSKGAKCHLLYGMAKDFCLAGFKTGFYYSEDEELIQAMNGLTYFHPVGTPSQKQVQKILSDESFLNSFISLNNEGLHKTYKKLINECEHLRFIPASAGMFALLDLSMWCNSFDEEDKIFNHLLSDLKINFSKGADLGMNTPGYFRVCFARSNAMLNELIKRLQNFKGPF